MQYDELLSAQEEYVIKLRREFHENPELSGKEIRTSKRVKEELGNMGVPFQEMSGTGVVGLIKGAHPGKTIALRADMDALCITEQNDVPYKSKNSGVMHACGHDAHTAMLLGAARALNEVRNTINGNIKLIFQPAEETIEGAKEMIAAGCLDGVDSMFGMHVGSPLKTGLVAIDKGAITASCDLVNIEFIGKGGHGAIPQECIDATVVASAFVMNIQSMISREIDPLSPVVFSIGKFISGTKNNIISGEAHLEGSIRSFDPAVRKALPEKIERYAKGIASAYNATAKVEYITGCPSIVNDEACTKIGKETIVQVLGENALFPCTRQPVSDDIAFYFEKVPGLNVSVGCAKDNGESFPHHHPRFDINERCLKIGTALFFRYALNFLA